MNPRTLFLQGLVVGTAASLVSEAFRQEAKDKGFKNSHMLALGLALFAMGVFFWHSTKD